MDASLRPEYIASSELATALRHPTEPRPIVVDVRDVDFAGGHIRTAINVPEWKFNDDANVDDLVERYKDEKQLVFHCMLSQVRGPKCAKRFLTRLQAVVKENAPRPVVQVLVGGYARFSELYKGETDLLED
ncbi:hypothetical protein Poli38472_006285 [Pythium oligandrum]|uniref:Rhodanese domain-containing protein n=1 Tax=Pythium oligandrum TaxID=41045 RepID=A0A8K1CU20_PYTOL|nr:hypothetical protein Poli38472_006285 [Pythium oligandrum]|eukprot:TMW68817.1 hypothetical protein Poli38472_006285 [Pythium oligandrum]